MSKSGTWDNPTIKGKRRLVDSELAGDKQIKPPRPPVTPDDIPALAVSDRKHCCNFHDSGGPTKRPCTILVYRPGLDK